jgi:hypothetical protein
MSQSAPSIHDKDQPKPYQPDKIPQKIQAQLNSQSGNRIQSIYGRKQQAFMTNQVQAVNSLSSANYNTTNTTKIPIKKKPAATDKLKDLNKRPADKPES